MYFKVQVIKNREEEGCQINRIQFTEFNFHLKLISIFIPGQFVGLHFDISHNAVGGESREEICENHFS